MKFNIKKNSFEELVNSIYQTHCVLQENAIRNVNLNLTIRNWLIGHYIVEYEQDGQDRAKYGDNLIGELSAKLKIKGLKGFSVSAIKNHRTFYLYYPQISQSVIGLLQDADIQDKASILKISQSAIGELQPEKKVLENFIKKELKR